MTANQIFLKSLLSIALITLCTATPVLAQGNSQWSPSYWSNQMKNNFSNKNQQNGQNNFFQDAKGFYKILSSGEGNTKIKFYFDVDFQVEMQAWMKAQGKSNARQNYNNAINQQYQAQQDQRYNQDYNQRYQYQPQYNWQNNRYWR